MKNFVFVALYSLIVLQQPLIAQNDTIWKGDTMIVIQQSAAPLPLYGSDYVMGNYKGAIQKIESESKDDNSMSIFVLSIIKDNDAERMKAILPALTQNAKFMWLYINPAVRTLVGTQQFKNDSAIARVYFEKTFGECDFEYFAVISKCKMQTELFRDMFWFYGEQDAVYNLMKAQQVILDSLNIIAIDSIIAIRKLPAKAKISIDGISNFVLCVQHFDKKNFLRYKKYMVQLKKKKEISMMDYAYYIDRFLVYKNRKQKFATQVRIGKNGEIEFYPLKRPKTINAKRKKIGIDCSKEDYLKMFM